MTTPTRYKNTCAELREAVRRGHKARAQELTKQATALHMQLFARAKVVKPK